MASRMTRARITLELIASLPPRRTQVKRIDYLQKIVDKRSRLVMASGDGPSPFSDAFMEVLGANREVVEASTIYRQLVDRLSDSSSGAVPEFAPLRWARSEGGGDFFFVPRRQALPKGP
jgi:hypothetical protein